MAHTEIGNGKMRLPAMQGGKYLYCIIAEVWRPLTREWVQDHLYTHAEDAHIARATYWQSIKPGTHAKIVGIAPVIGFKCDDNGENLSV